MAKKNRITLKEYFSSGRLPTQEDFYDLIDSMLNMLDEGFDKTADQGLKISQIGKDGKLMSFYQNIDVLSPIWSIQFQPGSQDLVIGRQEHPEALALRWAQNSEDKDPHWAFVLDVAGTLSSWGRIGQQGTKPVLADGQWHDITEPLNGCQAFEVMAGVGKKKSGQYAILHAFALNAFDSKSHITYHQAYYDSRCNRLELRWVGGLHSYTLQMRVGCSYEEGINVQYYLTRLWFDPFMEGCQAGQAKGGQ